MHRVLTAHCDVQEARRLEREGESRSGVYRPFAANFHEIAHAMDLDLGLVAMQRPALFLL